MAHGTPISILRLDRIDKRHAISIVLIHRKHAHNTLDLEIVASEGESAWATTLQESRLGQFKASDNTSTDDAWLQVLRASLLLDNPSTNTCSTSMPDLEGLEIVSQITKEGRLSLVVRQNLGKLTQRLGAIDLEPTDGERFDLWAGCVGGAVLYADARRAAEDTSHKLAAVVEHNLKLQQEIKGMLTDKKDYENSLLQKFTELLNAKKARIRRQQILLATTQPSCKKTQPRSSRTMLQVSKREAKAAAGTDEDTTDEFESVGEENNERNRSSTPELSEDNDNTPGDEDDDNGNTILTRGSGIPPRRHLPFSRNEGPRMADHEASDTPKTQRPFPPSEQSKTVADADDTTDDEL